MHIVVAGGGYAGLACLMELRKRAPDAKLTLVDPADEHLKVTHLQEAFRLPRGQFTCAFSSLGRKFRFEHIMASAGGEGADAAALAEWDETRVLPLHDGEKRIGEVEFDFLVIATGARSVPLPVGEGVVTLETLRSGEPGALLGAAVKRRDSDGMHATVVGGGANGIQFAFALREALRARGCKPTLSVVEAGPALVPALPARIGEYVSQQLERAGIRVMLETAYRQPGDGVLMLDRDGHQVEHRSDFTVLLPGLAPWPFAIEADRYGRLRLPEGVAERLFGAGDCARFDGRGLNSLTAQAAVRKGRQVGENVARVARGDSPLSYYFQELGYVVSMGAADAAGWILFRDNVLTGLPAFAIKHAIETQYDLFVAGIDTYLV